MSDIGSGVDEIAQAINRFTLDFYRHSVSDNVSDNTFASPYSIYTALSMLYAGAVGRTAAQLSDALSVVGDSATRHHNSVSTHAQAVQTPHMRSASRVYVEKQFALIDSFTQVTSQLYGAAAQRVDFATECDASRDTINAWVAEQTAGRIRELFAAGSLNTATRLALVNAVYFKADWADRFDVSGTTRGVFHAPHGDVTCDMMRRRAEYGYTVDRQLEVQAVELPYADDQLSMVLLLPNNKLATLESALDAAAIKRITDQLRPHKSTVNLTLPRFRIEYEIQLQDPLSALGIRDMFDADAADLSGISDRSLVVSAAVHKAFVEVNEEGTEAAAATGFGMMLTCIPQEFDFTVDRPCLVLIRHVATNTILFYGRLVDPTSK